MSDAVESWSLSKDDYDALHIMVMGDSEEATEQLICLFTKEEPVVAVDRKRIRSLWGDEVLKKWQVRREGRSFVLYQLPARCCNIFDFVSSEHYFDTYTGLRFLPIIWWVVCESSPRALSFFKLTRRHSVDHLNLPTVVLNCIMSAEKKCQQMKVLGCIRRGALYIDCDIDHWPKIGESLEEYLFKVSKHESVSSEKCDGDKGGQLFTIAMQAQGLSQLLQQSKNLIIEDGLNCAWSSWSLRSIYWMLHLSAKLACLSWTTLERRFVDLSSYGYSSENLSRILLWIWRFPFKNIHQCFFHLICIVKLSNFLLFQTTQSRLRQDILQDL